MSMASTSSMSDTSASSSVASGFLDAPLKLGPLFGQPFCNPQETNNGHGNINGTVNGHDKEGDGEQEQGLPAANGVLSLERSFSSSLSLAPGSEVSGKLGLDDLLEVRSAATTNGGSGDDVESMMCFGGGGGGGNTNFAANVAALAQIKQLQDNIKMEEQRNKEEKQLQQLQLAQLDQHYQQQKSGGDGSSSEFISSDFINASLAAASQAIMANNRRMASNSGGGYELATPSVNYQHPHQMARSISVPASSGRDDYISMPARSNIMYQPQQPSYGGRAAYARQFSQQQMMLQQQFQQQQQQQRHQMDQLSNAADWNRILGGGGCDAGSAARMMGRISPYAGIYSGGPGSSSSASSPLPSVDFSLSQPSVASSTSTSSSNGDIVNHSMQIRCKFGQLGQELGVSFNAPHGFCLGLRQEIIVADTNNHRIQIFQTDGSFLFSFGHSGKEEGCLWYPRKVAVSRTTGNFVVCDRGGERSRMQIFSPQGHFLHRITIRYIDIVAGLAISPTGLIVAVDSVTPTVFFIRESGALEKWFECSQYMSEPSDIAVAGNEYFICDFKGHSVVVFDEDGRFLRRIGCESVTPYPNGIDVSDAGDVLIGDSHGNQFHVAVYSEASGQAQFLSQFTCPNVKVSRCCGLKITSEGYIVTLAKNNHHVLVLNTLYIS